ncbi:MAG: HNH endonuclease [Atopobiaceae bacterium]|nr:HNH endonuclease [Atopobiaceae bacterium]MBR1830032.1 HNH endonuclease [Atopobiaceae bacterium]
MLESCLRVSYTSPKVMHWITELLCALVAEPDLSWSYRFASFVNDYARKAVQEWLVAGDSAQGVNTPHVVLNYLDYLLWRGARKDDFDFEFRTSVEHWYPQNPSDDTFVRWGEVDRFGNLCLVQRNVNSKFSNLNPVAKKSTYQEMIAGGSLKLREMAQLTDGVDSWKGGVCQRHEEEMLALLREACGVDVLVEAD